jgi:hypothetical protein
MVASEGGHMVDEEGKGNIKDHSYLTKRSLWKYSHQAVAFVCILLGFLNVLTGLNMKVLDEVRMDKCSSGERHKLII